MYAIASCVCFINSNLSKKMENILNARLIQFGVTRVQWMAMYYLLKYGDFNQNELGEKIGA